jgi:hypothetical protein
MKPIKDYNGNCNFRYKEDVVKMMSPDACERALWFCEITRDKCITDKIEDCIYADKELVRTLIMLQQQIETCYNGLIKSINNNYIDSIKERSG